MSRFQPGLLLALIFILGVASGVGLTLGLGPFLLHPPGEKQMRARWMMHLTHRLNLTADQQQSIQPILDQAERKIHALHQDEVAQMGGIIEAAHSQIMPLLTPEQQTELKKMARDHPHGFPGHDHGGPDDGPPGGGPPPAERPLPPPGLGPMNGA